MFYNFHRQDPWLKKVLALLWAFQLVFLLALVSTDVWLIANAGFQSTNIAVLVSSGVCLVLAVTEIVLFTATKLHPLAYLILQVIKSAMWFVLVTLTAMERARMHESIKAAEAQRYSPGPASEYDLTTELVENLVLCTTFLAALTYAGVVYHRHRRAKAHFFHSVLGADLFPVSSSSSAATTTHRTDARRKEEPVVVPAPPLRVQIHPSDPKNKKEAVEVTVLRELGGGDWNIYELPATRSVRNSRGGGKSVRSLRVG